MGSKIQFRAKNKQVNFGTKSKFFSFRAKNTLETETELCHNI